MHALGNLVIDTTSSNARKGRKAVNAKRQEYKKAPLMSQNEIVSSKTDWDDIVEVKEYIKKRDRKIKHFIRQHLLQPT